MEKLAEGMERIIKAMRKARDMVILGELPDGYEVSIDGTRLYVGRYFGPSLEQENTAGKFGCFQPVLPQIITFNVHGIPSEKRPKLSIMCAMCLSDIIKICYGYEFQGGPDLLKETDLKKEIGKTPNSEVAEDLSSLETALEERGLRLDVYRFTELNYVVLSLPITSGRP